MTTTVRVAHSPDSDDAFMFYGLASGAVKAEGVDFEEALSDIETLNQAATEGRYEITAISVHAYAHIADKYRLLDSGASFGDDYGPTVVVPKGSSVRSVEELSGKRIAIPGKWTSAALALALRLPVFTPVIMDFKAVGDAAKRGEVDAGLVIHEGQLTAEEEGLQVVEDLGKWWKGRTGLPLPLGLNAIRRDLPIQLREQLARTMAESIDYSLAHREPALDHAMKFARGLDRKRADTFVGMYVNDWTRCLGERGREAVALFLHEAAERGLVPRVKPEWQER
ncbi:menaquinone biosynthesis family protein [Anaeromyxobacter paludicola]|uniref:1,4-dihydroxy-6-naphtoate synthase n=1 Tax=Anaeromyxobacter paludicola TaxID=2918171 RepID=A0ABN6NA48_9BACT|nr:MqnA/MqnD/SBP family protein [Anaeromyxobacter paludicola]BDG10122.1 1,4-dihydroxy-6-naphtoate synthase [Anaeromyxobacter paludicola]